MEKQILTIDPNFNEKIILNNLKSDDSENTYILDIHFSSASIIFKIIEDNSLIKVEYSNEFTLEDLHKNSKFFKICENISNMKSSLEETFQMKKPLLKVEKNFIKLTIIPIMSALGESNLVIPKIKDNREENISILSKIIKNQQNEINNLNEKVNNYEERLKSLEEIIKKQNGIEELKERVKKLEEISKIKNDKNENCSFSLINNSKIIPNEKEKEKNIIEWINPHKNIKFTLIFRKSRDGSNGKDFHKYCDNQGPTLSLVVTETGYIFGGYTPINWESPSCQDKEDEATFIFSLKTMTKFTKYKEGYSIRLNKEFGPIFGNGHDFYLDVDMNKGYSYSGNYLRSNDLVPVTLYKVKEFEVFKVDII